MTLLARLEHTLAWRRARRILAVRLDNLGDVLMTTPALSALADDSTQTWAQPAARSVTLLTSAAGAALLPHVPSIADVIEFDAPWVAGAGHTTTDKSAAAVTVAAKQHAANERRLIAQLARGRFDAAVVFTVCTQSALPASLWCRLAGIPLRAAHSRENPYALLTDWVPDFDVSGPGLRHEVSRQLDLVNALGFPTRDAGLVFEYSALQRDAALHKLVQSGGAVDKPWVVVHPGSTAASRRYPPERFGEAARRIAARSGAQIVFSGGVGDVEACAQAQRAMVEPSVSLAGQLELGELGALIGGARLLVCNNSAPAHLAAAVGTPSVVLYALTNSQHTPWRAPGRVLNRDVPCRNCLKSVCPEGHHACLLGVLPAEVADAALDLWHKPPWRAVPQPAMRAA